MLFIHIFIFINIYLLLLFDISIDLIVHPYMRTQGKIEQGIETKDIVDSITKVFSRLHVLVVGPGLSRDKIMQDTARQLIYNARQQNMAIVIDADGLFLVQQHPDTIKDYKKAVLTPNVVEFKRLCESMNVKVSDDNKGTSAKQLSSALGGVTVVQKGSNDIIANEDHLFISDHPGGVKRMGGQGDILSGLIATFLAWGKGYEENLWEHDHSIDTKDLSAYASWCACTIVRESSRLAFEKYKRSVLTSHMLEEIGNSYNSFVDGILN
ncbi:H-hydrate dehydratase [Cunninghamella echinulata]|nr:H-hydrate dehydratase [Cunninghamella echinulata]